MSKPIYPSEEVVALRRLVMIVCTGAIAVLLTMWIVLTLMRFSAYHCSIFQESQESDRYRRQVEIEVAPQLLLPQDCHPKCEICHLSNDMLQIKRLPLLRSMPPT